MTFNRANQSLWVRINEPTYDKTAFVAERLVWLLLGAIVFLSIFAATLDTPKVINNGCEQTVTDSTIVLVCKRVR